MRVILSRRTSRDGQGVYPPLPPFPLYILVSTNFLEKIFVIAMSGVCKKCKRWAVLHPIHRLCYKCYKNSYKPTQEMDKWWMR